MISYITYSQYGNPSKNVFSIHYYTHHSLDIRYYLDSNKESFSLPARKKSSVSLIIIQWKRGVFQNRLRSNSLLQNFSEHTYFIHFSPNTEAKCRLCTHAKRSVILRQKQKQKIKLNRIGAPFVKEQQLFKNVMSQITF